MKTRNLIALMMVGLALSFTPALAQRGGGSRGGGGVSRGGGGGSHSSSMSSSRSSFSGSSSRSSSFSSSSRSSSPSYSSSSNRSSSVTSAPSAPTRSSSTSSTPAPARGSYSGTPATRGSYSGAPARGSYSGTRGGAVRSGAPSGGVATRDKAGAPGVSSHGAPVHNTPGNPGHHGGVEYARPGHPGVLPPSHRPIHPAPYFYHPWHGYVVHCHPIYWDPIVPRAWYWPGFWHYCNSYWYDYHVTDVVVVRDYVRDTYKVDIVTYGISGDIMYAIVRDDGDPYLQVYDNNDHLLAEQKINKKYCNMVIDPDNGGCWISKPGDKDPLLFIWAEGRLLIYEAD